MTRLPADILAADIREKDKARFIAKCSPADGLVHRGTRCWLWTGYLQRHQNRPVHYGGFWFRGAMVYAHRFSYAMHHGDLTGQKEVDHTCENPACVNPFHLEAVGRDENLRRRNGRTTEGVEP